MVYATVLMLTTLCSAGLGEKICHHFLETVAADFDAINVADALDAEFAVTFLGGDFERGQRLGDEMVLRRVMDGHAQVHLDLAAAELAMALTAARPNSRFGGGFGSRGLQVGGGGSGNTNLLRAGGAGYSSPAPELSTPTPGRTLDIKNN